MFLVHAVQAKNTSAAMAQLKTPRLKIITILFIHH